LAKREIELDARLRPRSWLHQYMLLLSSRKYDAVVVQRKLLEKWDVRLLRMGRARIFFDVDDAVMHHPKPVGLIERWRSRRRFTATANGVDVVVAGSESLARMFREKGACAIVIPTTLDLSNYKIKSHAPTESPRLVWIGSRSTLPYLQEFLPVLVETAKRVAGLRLVTIADCTIEQSPIPVEHVPWSLENEADSLACGDIGIAPTPSSLWTQGKCGFKILQYMAAGLPVVASPVGANMDIVADGQTGILPARAEDWPMAIETLAKSPALRAQMGCAGRARVEANFTNQRAADLWEKTLLNGAV
jgi:glycosyltransferase involved in cell wall biosynthesis